jgi:hypothetical protein
MTIVRYFGFHLFQKNDKKEELKIYFKNNEFDQPSPEYKRNFENKMVYLLSDELCWQYNLNAAEIDDNLFSWAFASGRNYLFWKHISGVIEMMEVKGISDIEVFFLCIKRKKVRDFFDAYRKGAHLVYDKTLAIKPEERQINSAKNQYNRDETMWQIEDRLMMIEKLQIAVANKSTEWKKIAKSLASHLGNKGIDYFRRIMQAAKNHKYSENEIQKIYSEALKKRGAYTIGTFLYYCRMAINDAK